MAVNKFNKSYLDGSVYHINFGKTFFPELNSKHLGVIFTIKSSNNMVVCLPMTSPKDKHFNTIEGFNNRDFRDLKYPHLYYIKQTDSIVLFEQFKCISKARIESAYKDNKNNKIVLNNYELTKLKQAFESFMNTMI